MKKMKRKIWALLLTVAMVISSMSVVAFAEDGLVQNQLKEDQTGYAGENFDSIDDFNLYNPMNLNCDPNDPYADFSYWHFIDSSRESDHIEVSFEKPDGEIVVWTVYPCHTTQPPKMHYAVITPSDWKLADGVSYSSAVGEFNLSHSGRHEQEPGRVRVEASVAPWYTEITPHEYYERDVKEFYERTVDEYYERTETKIFERDVFETYERDVTEFYERDVDEYYERDVFEYYKRDIFDIWQRRAQRYLIPVFERKLAGAYDGTLVTRLTYSDNTIKAQPVNGGAFKNGHTYVTIDVEEATKEGGLWFEIADSSKNNGKKTPDQYNIPVGYRYNVQIKDGKLTITCDEDLAYAGVGVFVYDKAPKDAKNAPAHYEGSVTADIPDNDGTLDLYVHFEKLGWYDKDEAGNYIYQFKEWKADPARTVYDETLSFIRQEIGEYYLADTVKGEYQLIDTQYGEYELVDTKYGEYKLADTQYGEYELTDTQCTDWDLKNTEYGEYELADTQYGEWELVKEEEISRIVYPEYDGTLTLTVTGQGLVDEEKPLGETFELEEPGIYTFTITGSGTEFEPISKEVEIRRGDNETIVFDPITYELPTVTLDTVKHETDREAEKEYADKEATRHEETITIEDCRDREAVKKYQDKETTKEYQDREAIRHETEREPVKDYQDNNMGRKDIKDGYYFNEDIKLGNEEDPYGEYAERLN